MNNYLEISVGNKVSRHELDNEAKWDLRALMVVMRSAFNEGGGFWLTFTDEDQVTFAYWMDITSTVYVLFAPAAYTAEIDQSKANAMRAASMKFGAIDFTRAGFSVE